MVEIGGCPRSRPNHAAISLEKRESGVNVFLGQDTGAERGSIGVGGAVLKSGVMLRPGGVP